MTASLQPPASRALWEALAAEQRAVLQCAAEAAAAEGGEAYLVGGPVRDLLRGDTDLHDIDIVTTTDARRVAKRCAAGEYATVTRTTHFGTATVHFTAGEGTVPSVDFATARTESYRHPGALPEVVLPASIHDDLLRRDVTINAMALPITAQGFGPLLDPTDGLTDLRNGVVRVLHDSSFRDDPTRLYRAARYAARFGFAIERHTAHRIAEAVAGGALGTISGDRKRHEIALGLFEPDAVACLTAFHAHGLLLATSPTLVWDEWVAVRIRHYVPHPTTSSRRAIRGHGERHGPSLYPIWAYFVCRQDRAMVERLFIDLSLGAMKEPIRRLIRVWEERDAIAQAPRLSMLAPLLEKLHAREVLALLVGEAAALNAAAFFARLPHVYHQDSRWARSFGDFLIAIGIPPGPVYKEILSALRNARLDGAIETTEEAEAYVRAYAVEHGLIPR